MKPILFNTEMVRAILESRKTVTRRVVKIPSYVEKQDDGLFTLFTEGACYEGCELEEIQNYLNQPYQVNDILYVRETWRELITPVGAAKDYSYKADIHNAMMSVFNGLWRPSIHMPKEAARIFLRVTDVRLERLQDMQLEDFIAEGVRGESIMESDDLNYRFNFVNLWNSTIKKEQYGICSWSANPYVWVIEFEVIPKEVAMEGLK